jgi:acetolactate synthase-1/3 small subunit
MRDSKLRDTASTHYPVPEGAREDDSFHTLTMIVRDKAGTLARIVNLFSARNYNIHSLSASNVNKEKGLASITILTCGNDKVIDQIIRQLSRLVNVYNVTDVSSSRDRVVREMALVKVKSKGQKRMEALSIANSFHATIIDATSNTIILEIGGAPQKVNAFIEVLYPLGVIDVVKTGLAGMVNSDQSPMEEITNEAAA